MLRGLGAPERNEDTAPFWRGCDDGVLLLQRCAACSAFRWPPGPACSRCGACEVDWVPSASRGTVYSWVVVHVAFAEALADQLPYVVGLVELEEEVRIVSTIEGCEPGSITAGMPVEIRFDQDSGERRFAFVPADPAAGR